MRGAPTIKTEVQKVAHYVGTFPYAQEPGRQYGQLAGEANFLVVHCVRGTN